MIADLLQLLCNLLLGALAGVLFLGVLLVRDQVDAWRRDGVVDPGSE